VWYIGLEVIIHGTEELYMEQKNYSWNRRIIHGTEELYMEQKNYTWNRRFIHGTEELEH